MTLRSPRCVPEFPKRFERSEAVERLDRLEQARGYGPVTSSSYRVGSGVAPEKVLNSSINSASRGVS